QAWGAAQIMGALHEDNAGYYGTTPITGHPSDAWGWVIGAGLKINTPFISQGDYLDAEANYTQGALKYLWDANPSNEQGVNGATEGFGIMSDCVYGGTVGAGATGCQLTSAWEIDVGYEHYWTPQWHESFVFNGMWTKYGTSGNNMLCSAEGAGNGLAGSAGVALAGCNNNWDDDGAGSRLQWDVTKSFYVGVEALYQHLDSATLPGGLITKAVSLTNSGATTVADQNNWSFTVRMHKDFLP
ncbi:MAG: porin, partial [Xanthobacteraceae bacterium]